MNPFRVILLGAVGIAIAQMAVQLSAVIFCKDESDCDFGYECWRNYTYPNSEEKMFYLSEDGPGICSDVVLMASALTQQRIRVWANIGSENTDEKINAKGMIQQSINLALKIRELYHDYLPKNG
eukprot:GHVS01055378.1.p1 GENE.GHVS01055378.1~~GHVS01055378.1.p1  ORF type:complete len:124 (+),score=3.03 GHVS01055378.1:119-490(+)